MLATPLCRDLGITYPIFNVGFGTGARPELAAAVSNAGGCGVLGLSALSPDYVRTFVRRTRELTNKPFGGNIIIAGMVDPERAPALEERIPVLILFSGDAAPFVEDARKAGTKLFIQGRHDGGRARGGGGRRRRRDHPGRRGRRPRQGQRVDLENLPATVEAVAPVPCSHRVGSVTVPTSRARCAALGRRVRQRRPPGPAGGRHRSRARRRDRGRVHSIGDCAADRRRPC